MSSPISLDALRGARWFAGKHRRIAGVRTIAAWPAGGLSVADVAFGDEGDDERYLLLGDGLRWGPLLEELRDGPIAGDAGRIELRAAPALAELLRGNDDAEAIPSTDQSNTLVTLGATLLIKAYRKLAAGVHPEVELGAALAGTGAPVPAFGGSLHWVAPDGTDTAIALLQEYVAGAVSGWEEPIEAVAAHLRAGTSTTEESVSPYAAAGAAAGALHAALASKLGVSIDATAPSRWHADALATLADAERLEPRAAAAAPAIRTRLATLRAPGAGPAAGGALAAGPAGPAHAARLTRIHGDLHFAQFLRTPERTLIVDLEGDPTAPLERRRRPDTPLRDLAALLRSIDHIGTASARRADAIDPQAFIAAASAATLDAYNKATGTTADPALLAALELAAELRELVYAHRVVPEWAYAPQAGLQRLLQPPATTP